MHTVCPRAAELSFCSMLTTCSRSAQQLATQGMLPNQPFAASQLVCVCLSQNVLLGRWVDNQPSLRHFLPRHAEH
jgi:hypothetical protein